MKKLLFLLILLTACTGTSEPPLDLLLAVGDGNTVAFYPSGSDDASAVGSWDVGAEVIDLLRPEGESRLWVLTPSKLQAYPLVGGTLTSPPNLTAAEFSFDLGISCANGGLQTGEALLLLNCGGGHAWTLPFSSPALEPLNTSEDAANTIYLLGPDDLITRITFNFNNFQVQHPGPDLDYSYTVETDNPVDHLVAIWSQQVLYIAVDSGSDTRMYTWEVGDTPPKPVGNPLPVTGVLTILPLKNGWLVGGKYSYVIHQFKKSDLLRIKPITTALATPNFFAYLAGPGELTVLDLLDTQLSEHTRSFPANPRGLDWLPVGE